MAPGTDLETALLGAVAPGRDCGGCAVCCDILKIDTPDLRKAAAERCVHRSAEGCGIHATRPDICRAWFCGWRRNADMPDAARPDRSGLLVSLDFVREPRNCLEGVAIVVRSLDGAAPFRTDLAEEIVDRLCDQLVPVWLHDGSNKVLVHPESDVARHVIGDESPPAHLRAEVAAWRTRYGMFDPKVG
ncbi:YkgJ family cysteine cluster protein [Sphingomonas oryzagri]